MILYFDVPKMPQVLDSVLDCSGSLLEPEAQDSIILNVLPLVGMMLGMELEAPGRQCLQ